MQPYDMSNVLKMTAQPNAMYFNKFQEVCLKLGTNTCIVSVACRSYLMLDEDMVKLIM